ncbi:polysaccharide deacetylase family protein [Halobacillus yeomjeoni]|uniref:Polysaccharide deacetylase family protein n=1 Tax=Halobacillus yeomjeoni TaxID=311194 RepID=A0A931MU03_9BACI|nr:polysaccharide deacetylase family protein [Halobacillus yeomjeoni]MBH0228991.1 polysaccharide deacetylase family protein [Halobacillus yeomjeoni]
MKKAIVFLCLALFLAACSGATGEGKDEQKSNQTQEEQNSDEMKNASDEEQGKEEATDHQETINQNEDDTEEETKESTKPEAQEPQYELTGNWSLKPISDANPEVVLLTIDDAPDNHGVEMAETLQELNAPAIFFVNGHFIDTPEGEEELKQIHDMGFAIGNHTETHASLPDLTKEEQREEIVGLSDKIEKIIGERPKFFRAPFGQNTDFSKELVQKENMLLMNWTYGYDWNKEYMKADSLADIMVNTELLSNGANLLMHDREWTAEALPDIVKGLKDKGYDLLDPALIQTP